MHTRLANMQSEVNQEEDYIGTCFPGGLEY